MKVAAILLGLGGVALTLLLLTKRAKAAEAELATVDDIMGAESLAELNAWYYLINELFITEQISQREYAILYDAYYTRFNELAGGGA